MKYDAVQCIKLRHFSINHRDLWHQGLMSIFCPMQNISVFHVVNKNKQCTFHYKDPSKVINGVFFISLVTSDSSGFWKTADGKSGLIRKGQYFGITYSLFFFFNTVILKKHRACILCMRQLGYEVQNKQHWKHFQGFVSILGSFKISFAYLKAKE